MGSAFARLLRDAGYDVVAYDTDPARSSPSVRSVADVVAADPSVVVLSLPSEDALASVARELSGSFVVAETSTMPLAAKESAREVLRAAGVGMVDCPVSGTGTQAQSGDLIVYASGDDRDLDECEPVLRAFSRAVHRVGPFGAGSKLKYLANLLVAVHNAAAAEMLALAARAGVDPAVALALVADGAGQSRMLEVRGPGMAAGTYPPAATVDVFRKDMRIITAFAAEAGAATPLLGVAARLYDLASARGLGGEDTAIVHRLYLDGTAALASAGTAAGTAALDPNRGG
jgi:3-hydroxyisobutyrate dehydrogenase-like beta-hydroxyacid dehydrogenase